MRTALTAAPPLAIGLILRLWMLKNLFQVNGDSLIYGDIAKNLLQHGRYAFSGANGDFFPTLIRLPGYPFLLALCFRLFGMENYYSAALLQIALELMACLLLADFAGRITSPDLATRARYITLWLAALCPFTASYAAAPLAETPTLFALALALWAAARFHHRPGWANALWFTFAVTIEALLRPDGALVAIALAPALVLSFRRANAPAPIPPQKLMRMTFVCILLALVPFTVWTVRNWQTFHVFEPLAPRLANDPGEDPLPGWESWTPTVTTSPPKLTHASPISPSNASPPIPSAITSGCPLAASPIWCSARASKTSTSTLTGGSFPITTKRLNSVTPTRC